MGFSNAVDPAEIDRIGLAAVQRRIDFRLEQLLCATAGRFDTLHQATRYALLAPGKRIRPMLTMLAGCALGPDHPATLEAACALEMIHSASLILDDLPSMDDAKLRRGRPTTHLVFGEDVAILAAISLLSRSFGVVSQAEHLPGSVRSELVGILSHATGACGLAGGQVADLRHGAGGPSTGHAAVVSQLKTGVLFVAAIDMAAAIAEVNDQRRSALHGFAEYLGSAFQLRDDLLDGTASSAVMGKDAGQDHGKTTLVNLLGMEAAARRMQRNIDDGLASLAPLAARAAPLRELVRHLFAETFDRADGRCPSSLAI
jgi:geranylgeranyl diphosphate synthase type II